MSTLRYLAERLIGRAEASGDLRGLEGEGAPLADIQSAHVEQLVDPRQKQTTIRIAVRRG